LLRVEIAAFHLVAEGYEMILSPAKAGRRIFS